jgi:hypothetical protein
MAFLLSEPKSSTCTRLAEIANISHDSINRFLERENYEPKDLFDEAKTGLELTGGILSVDDTVLDKPYSKYISLVGHFWSGKHHKVSKGINLITLYYTDINGLERPLNYRVVDKFEGKSKHDYFLEMLAEVLAWGVRPACVTGDSWYSCVKNLKTVKEHGLGFMFAIECNRLVSVEKGDEQQVKTLDIPRVGKLIWLKKFGYVKVFRTHLKEQVRHYIIYMPDDDQNEKICAFERKNFEQIHSKHWQIESYHRAIKQVCHVEHFQVRNERLIRNHLFAALCSYIQLQKMQITGFISSIYALNRKLFTGVIANFITGFVRNIKKSGSEIGLPVNA